MTKFSELKKILNKAKNPISARKDINEQIEELEWAVDKCPFEWTDTFDSLLQKHDKACEIRDKEWLGIASPYEKEEYYHQCDLFDSSRKGECHY
tara:strand:- start:937 stop:1218 length:282 start_codon:yes stop_codon:yes gene_type:complete